MKKTILIIKSLFFIFLLQAQEKNIRGAVFDSLSGQPIAGATIHLSSDNQSEITDESGRFFVHTASLSQIIISATGFETKNVVLITNENFQSIRLCPVRVKLADVVITANSNSPYKALMETDIGMRGVANSQEVLRMVPGLFIGQHQGGGKAEQIFLRGFDADHGHDINITADGIAVNMVSHAHGQGYADSHYIIAETIENASFNKGPYDAEKGDMATAGYLEFHTFNSIRNNTIKLEGGQFGTFRGLAMFDLLNKKSGEKQRSWYLASEYSYTNGYFDSPEHFKRFNLFTKFNYKLSSNQTLTLSASTFHSSWFASGQIPERAIDSGLVDYYGALDHNEGGVTGRTNANIQLQTSLSNGGMLKNQIYYSSYQFDLHSNFTFFLTDTINGDEIRQKENRNLFGYNGSYQHENNIAGMKLSSQFGITVRYDATNNTALLHTRDRYTLLNTIKLGDIGELENGYYIREALKLTSKWHLKAGIRFDQFYYRYNNKFAGDTTLNGLGIYKANNHVVSPKLSLYYQANHETEWYLSLGKGFHSNDARVVVAQGSAQTLPAAYAADLGFIYKPFGNLLIHAAAWYIFLQKEYVYGGDGGTIEFSGRTRRIGVDFSGRYQAGNYLFFDADINFAHGRSIDDSKGNNFIPEAPVWSSVAGVGLVNKSGWSASLRYRYLSKRPASPDYTLTCAGYFVNDLVIKYKHAKFEYGLIINNLFNVRWREAQLDATTRFKNEQTPVDGISFTPGTKFAAKLSMNYFFQ